MSQLIVSRPGPSFLQVAARVVWARATAAVAAIRREWRCQRDLKLLEELDGRALHDLGIAHGELEHLVRHGRPTRHAGSKRARPRHEDVPLGDGLPCRSSRPSSWTEWR